jgi:hypothetical protein
MSEPDPARTEAQPTSPTAPTPEQVAERARRADKATRGAMAAVLVLEAVVVLLIPRTIVFTSGLGPVRTGICFGVAALLLFGAAVTRRSWGIGLGSVLQVVFTATGFLIGTMFLIGAIFAAIWLRLLMLRHDIVGTPGGLRMLTS